MLHTTRRLLTGPLLVAAIGAGLIAAPAAAEAAPATAVVKVNNYLMVRAEPKLSAPSVGTLRKDAKVTIACVVTGTSVRGTVRTSDLWDRLSTGHYIPHAYVQTSAPLTRCASGPQVEPVKTKPSTTGAFVVGTVRSTDGRVNVRSAPSTSAAVQSTLGNGDRVNIVCGANGDLVNGSVRSTTAWARLSNGNYVSWGYVRSSRLSLCPGSVTPPAASLTPEQFIAAAVPGAQAGWREYGVPPSVTIAQAILESGWGRSGLASVDRNYFGIKCFDGKFGKLANGCHVYKTQECTKAGTCFNTTATFRTYATMGHSFRDHGSFLRVNPRYSGAFAYSKSSDKFIWKVWKAGYATDPNYYTKVTGIMASWNLYRYDTWK